MHAHTHNTSDLSRVTLFLFVVIQQPWEFDEEAIAVSCLKKKLKTFESSASEGDRRRIANFLERKGFPSEIISQVVARLTPYASDNDWVPPSSAPNQNK